MATTQEKGSIYNKYAPLIDRQSVDSLMHDVGGTYIDRLKDPQKTERVRMTLAEIRANREAQNTTGPTADASGRPMGGTPYSSPFPASPNNAPAEKKPGFFKSLAQGVTSGAAQVFGALGTLAGETLNTGLRAGEIGMANLKGDKKKAAELQDTRNRETGAFAEGFDIPGGKWTGGKTNTIDTIPEAWGRAAQLGSMIGASDLFKNVAVNTVRGAIWQGFLQGAGSGAVSGALGGAGTRLVEDKTPTVGETAIAGGIGGVVGGVAGGVLGGVGGAVGYTVRKAAEKLQAWKNGELLSQQSKQFQQAVSKDIAPEDAAYVAVMSPEDKAAALRMLDLKKTGLTARGKDAVMARPEVVTGETWVDQVKHLWNVKKEVGAELGNAIKAMPDKPQNVAHVFSDFVSKLDDSGVKVDYNGKLDFADSIFDTASGSKDQALLQGLFDKLKPSASGDELQTIANSVLQRRASQIGPQALGDVLPEDFVVNKTPKQIDLMVKSLFDELDLGKKGNVFTTRAAAIGNDVRGGLRQTLVDLDPKGYGANATKYAQIIDSLDDFYSSIGRKWSDESGDMLNLKAGEVGNRMLGNASGNVLNTALKVENTAKATGYNKNVSLVDQVYFSDLLEGLFGTNQTRALAGSVEKGVSGAITKGVGVAQDVGNRNFGNLLVKGINAVKGVNAETQMAALRQLLLK